MNWKSIFSCKLVGLILLVLLFFLFNQNAIVFPNEEKQAQEEFPSSPPVGIKPLTIHDGSGNSIKIALWGRNGRFFWYFEPVTESFDNFYLYPYDITVTQDKTLYQEIKFINKNGDNFFGHIKEPLILEFTACDWFPSGIECIDYSQPFEIFLPPGNIIEIKKINAVKLKSLKIK